MSAPPMPRWQNALALAAALLASAGLLPLRPPVRISCATLAIVTLIVLLLVRLRTHRARRGQCRGSTVYDRIDRIRSERARRRR